MVSIPYTTLNGDKPAALLGARLLMYLRRKAKTLKSDFKAKSKAILIQAKV